MDFMIWVVAIALLGYVLYAMYTTPPSSGCLSADLARALDEKKRAEASRRRRRTAEPAPPVVAAVADSPPPESVAAEDSSTSSAPAMLLRNPSTGETASVPGNYRFAKRWIKEALVAEGLLDKVYSSAELDAAASEKVKAALSQFRTLAKYHA